MRSVASHLSRLRHWLRARRERSAALGGSHDSAAERLAGQQQAAMHAGRHHAGPHGGSGGV